MKIFIIISLMLMPFISKCQDILKDANVIVVKNVGFIQICNALLDSGYTIERKDNDLQTAETELRQYPKYWNATYSLRVRVKDSVGYISALYNSPPDGQLFKNEKVTNLTNKKGGTLSKSLDGYIFLLINRFALSFGNEVSYLIKK